MTLLDRLPTLAAYTAGLLIAFLLGGMLLGREEDAGVPVDASAQATTWTCAMHPQIQMAEPGLCPICGMDLIPASADSAVGPDEVVLSARARTLAQLQTTVVQRQPDASADLRLLGRIEAAESSRREVTAWIGGRIDRLYVDETGERVRPGMVIATLYSPEVYGAHQDLLVAQQQVTRLSSSPPAAQAAAAEALGAAQERLRLLGVPERELTAMESATEPTRAVPIRSPFGGTVIERVATEGAYVKTGAVLYRVADLRSLWVQLDAYEADLPRLAVGQSVTLRAEGLPGEVFVGQVAFIEPTVDAQRRTARVRVEVESPDGKLRPGMFAEAVVAVDTAPGEGAPLVIPDSAPLFTGKRSVVYVEEQDGDRLRYTPRTVRLGPRLGAFYPVISGLSAGERVVSRGAFALDADLQIRGGPSMMTAPDDRTRGEDEPVVSLSDAQQALLVPVMEAYLGVQRALAEDDLAGTTAAAAALEQAVASASASAVLDGAAGDAWTHLAAPLRMHSQHIVRSSDLEGARGGFEPLSLAVEALLRRLGNPLSSPVQVAFCPMVKGNEGARWVQQGEEIDNAYFGNAMRGCGEIRAAVAPGMHLESPPEEAGAAGERDR